jgi:hypothetical protein
VLLTRENNDTDLRRLCLNLLAQIVTIVRAEQRINKGDDRALCLELRQGVGGAIGKDHLVVLTREGDLKHLTHGFAVVDGEQSSSHGSSGDWNIPKAIIRLSIEKCQGFRLSGSWADEPTCGLLTEILGFFVEIPRKRWGSVDVGKPLPNPRPS